MRKAESNIMKIQITINNQTLYKEPSIAKIKAAILEILESKKVISDVILGLEIVDKKEIKKLNKKFRKKDEPTDVLSFPIHEVTPKIATHPVLLGDIVICPEVLKANAKKYKIDINNEFIKLIQHSTLHLLGYHHKE